MGCKPTHNDCSISLFLANHMEVKSEMIEDHRGKVIEWSWGKDYKGEGVFNINKADCRELICEYYMISVEYDGLGTWIASAFAKMNTTELAPTRKRAELATIRKVYQWLKKKK